MSEVVRHWRNQPNLRHLRGYEQQDGTLSIVPRFVWREIQTETDVTDIVITAAIVTLSTKQK